MFERNSNDVLAAWIHRHANVVGHPAPLTMALELGLTLVTLPVGGGATLLGESIIWDPSARLARQQALVLREICRWTLRQHQQSNDNEDCTSLAVAFNSYALLRSNVRPLTVVCSTETGLRRPLAKISHGVVRHPVLRSGTHPAVPRS